MTQSAAPASKDMDCTVSNLIEPLGLRLQSLADDIREKSPDFAKTVDAFVARLQLAHAGNSTPKVGDLMPRFVMPDHDGKLVSLDEIIARGPTILAYYRGHWCPYCRLNITGLTEIQDKVGSAQIYAITPELQRHTRSLRAESGVRFPILTDMDAGYALSLGLGIWVDDTMSAMIAEAGKNVPSYQGGHEWVLPIPSVFVIDGDGIVRARHVDPDYRRRMELESILDAVRDLGCL